MGYCTKCGKQNPDTAKFCTGCGAAITPSVLIQPEKGMSKNHQFAEKKKNKNTGIMIAVAALVAMGAGAYFIFFNKKKGNKPAITNTLPAKDTNITQPVISRPESSHTTPNDAVSYTDMNDRLVYRSDCFVIITGSFADENYARGYVNTMKNEGHNNAGYLWIPDYPSLSGKTFYATFIGPYQTYSECENNLRTLKVNSRFWYGKKVSYNPEQIEIRIK